MVGSSKVDGRSVLTCTSTRYKHKETKIQVNKYAVYQRRTGTLRERKTDVEIIQNIEKTTARLRMSLILLAHEKIDLKIS